MSVWKSNETEWKWQMPICHERPHGGAREDTTAVAFCSCTCKECVHRPIHGFIIWKSVLYLCTMFVLWLANPDLLVLLLSSICLFIFLSFFSFFFFFFPPRTSAGQQRLKSLFMRIITWSKALHSAALPPGPVALLLLVSCPIPFRRVDERAWWTHTQNPPPPKQQQQ